MEEDFRAILTASAAVTALVPADRIDWGLVGQGKPLPYVRLSVISNRQGHTQQGPDGLWQGRVQVDVIASSYGEASTIATAITAQLDFYRGGRFRGIFLDFRRPDETQTAATDRPQRIILDFLTNWRADNAD